MGRHATQTTAPRGRSPLAPWRAAVLISLLIWAALAIAGVGYLWPGGKTPQVSPSFYQTFSVGTAQVDGTVSHEQRGSCSSPEAGRIFTTSPRVVPGSTSDCQWYLVDITSGENSGQRTLIINSGEASDPTLSVGQKIRLTETKDTNGDLAYAFGDINRSFELILWALAIAGAIVALALMRGIRALIGLGLTLIFIAKFTIPALLLGENPLAIAVLSGSVILPIVVILVHGLNWKSAAALGGTMVALAVAAWLATVAIEHNQIRGLGEEGNLYILLYLPDVNVVGLMLCGFIIGSLGVLNDVAVAQASTINELAELDPEAKPWRLFVSAMRVGRDHISSMVYTLVLTYTGATLPMMLLLSVSDRPLGQILSSDLVATELLRSGIGAFALTLSVPLTTLLAAYTVPDSTRGSHAVRQVGHSH
ncbi:YibE/F family protein [Corynebacterium sp. ES2775-CONJ]|uniref:YibE/F family protein n=1 Tax=Corynebacterium sp. ES2775-CONJ TaxID=2974029 RepID=UPI002169F349|nr:YibE/F family protein [Corynebacterium sp. ES2775-CONJ]MCS4490166.1 YibE/F family protein [Corynebacterium sp. ES2775-CONJ]